MGGESILTWILTSIDSFRHLDLQHQPLVGRSGRAGPTAPIGSHGATIWREISGTVRGSSRVSSTRTLRGPGSVQTAQQVQNGLQAATHEAGTSRTVRCAGPQRILLHSPCGQQARQLARYG